MDINTDKLTIGLALGFCLTIGAISISQPAWARDMINFTDSKGGALKIKPEHFDTPQAKQFMSSGKNPYIGDKKAIENGKKIYHLYSCNQCHGSNAQGQTAHGLTGPRYNHAKSAEDKGMFEITWAGTDDGMSAKGKGLMDPTDPNNGLSPDELLQVIAWVRSQAK
ncbi:MAG: c-type cytochrome [Nitrosomonadales bacterium]|nr:c-type cytochrome [Nitrosomonadales bacterium]